MLSMTAVWAWSGCVAHYTDGLGYRAHQAVLRRDLPEFEHLMEEAAHKVPSFPREKPKRTVLTHFLDLAGDPHFVSIVEHWQAKGWVDETQTCAIHRARYRHTREIRPEEAAQAAEICVDRARAAAYAADRAWEVEACLDEAPFLTETSTQTLIPYLEMVGDAAEPRRFRHALLQGMTTAFLQDRMIRHLNQPEVPEEVLRAQAEAQWASARARFVAIVEAVRSGADGVLVGAGSALGALELERVALTEGTSFMARYALDAAEPERSDLAWAWVKSIKTQPVIRRFEGLGLWDRRLEPEGDAFWYVCGKTHEDPVFGRADVRMGLVGAQVRLSPREVLAEPDCDTDAWVRGPFPLAVTARGAVIDGVKTETGMARVSTKERFRRMREAF